MIRLFSTSSRKIEKFEPISGKQIGIYACGPTVYDAAHIGNLRTYIFEDELKRVLEFGGYKVNLIENITDIDDKTIKRAEKEKVSLNDLTRKYEKLFFADIEKLNIELASKYPRATEHIQEMTVLIQKLLDKGFAYLSGDGSIYYKVSTFKDYGNFAHLDMSGMRDGAKVQSDEYEKESSGDFVLWKVHTSSDGDNFWTPKFNIKLKTYGLKLIAIKGRPGWHIECSAMSQKYLGPTFDIHAGAVDLVFPHHQNEIAQSEAVTGKPMAKYWIHGEHLLVDGKKMAKSAGNFYTLGDIEKKGINPLAFRYLCLESHYRSKMNFSWDSLEASENTLKNIRDLAYRDNKSTINKSTNQQINESTVNEITNAFCNDLDTPKALALLHKANNFELWLKFDSVLGLKLSSYKVIKLSSKAEKMIKDRDIARQKKDFALADKIRIELEKEGIVIEDTPNGTKIIPKN